MIVDFKYQFYNGSSILNIDDLIELYKNKVLTIYIFNNFITINKDIYQYLSNAYYKNDYNISKDIKYMYKIKEILKKSENN